MRIDCNCGSCGAPLVRKSVMSMYFCTIKCKAQWQRSVKPVTEEWLRDAYCTRGMDCTQIAEVVGRDSKTVWNWLRGYGIETRRRGTTGNHVHSIGAPRTLTESGRLKLSAAAKAARAADGRIPCMKGGKHWLHHDGAVHPNDKGGITPERQSHYASQEWKDAVKAVWKRDGFACVRCSSDLRHKRGECAIHHIVGFANVELRSTVSNLVLLCKPCHLWVHSNQNAQKEFIK